MRRPVKYMTKARLIECAQKADEWGYERKLTLSDVGGVPTASALGSLTIEQEMEQVVFIPARGFALALDSPLDGLVLAQE